VRTHPGIATERRFQLRVLPHPKLSQQSVTATIPTNQWKQQLIVKLAPSLIQNQRPYKLYIMVNGMGLGQPAVPAPTDPIEPGSRLYDASLHAGVNNIQVQVIAALPKGQKLANGAEVELETITLLANVLRA
jgi:hypothetical protein